MEIEPLGGKRHVEVTERRAKTRIQKHSTIKESMPEWLNTMNRYDDPDVEDMGDVWGF
jgi:hypothetical protein